MGTQERRERERQETRQRILDAARELFARDGYDAVSMRRVAEKIEYSATALYFHFKDKDALFRELCNADFLELAQAFNVLARIADPVERLRQIGLAYVQFGIDHRNHYRLMFMTPHPCVDPVEPEDVLVQQGNPETDAYAFFMSTIRECMATGRFRPEYADPDLIAQMLWAGTHGIIALHIIMAGSDQWVDWRPPMATAAAQIDAVTRGLLRSPEA
jgi:AcrR family transcriptional regulator